jgi:hypothetical protein
VGGQRGSVGEGEVAGVGSPDNNGFSNLACRRGAPWVNYTGAHGHTWPRYNLEVARMQVE